MALHEPDWPWAEDICLSLLSDARKEVRSAALTSLGHLARLHSMLHLEIVVPAVKRLLADPDSRGVAEDTLDDITRFVNHREMG
jgi:hypothetical protein